MRVCNFLRVSASLLALIFAIGCTDADGGTDVLPTLTEPGFYPLLNVQAPSNGQSAVTLSLKQVPGGIELASAQGEIAYDAGVLQLSRATLPEGLEGDVEEVSPGRIRFVATLVQGAAETPLLHLHFSGRDKPAVPAREMFQVRFEEVTGGAELADLTSTVRSDQLLFLRSR